MNNDTKTTSPTKSPVRSPNKSKTTKTAPGGVIPFSNTGRGGGGSNCGPKKQVRGQTAKMVKQAQELYAEIVNKGFS